MALAKPSQLDECLGGRGQSSGSQDPSDDCIGRLKGVTVAAFAAAPPAPGKAVEKSLVREINELWGFDMLQLYKAPLPGYAGLLHQIVVLRMEGMDRDRSATGLGEATFLHLQYFPTDGLRFQKVTGPSDPPSSTLVKACHLTRVCGFRIADVLDDFMRREADYDTCICFAEAVVAACGLQSTFSFHLENAHEELQKLWYEELERQRKQQAAIATTAAGAALLCAVQ
eukprot:TRINITY_DN5178_c0_g6_i1.p1 TRINITY_DN5178_c0_g6~~TRINITY_DN5178_c0_g6_i1.p1  ORF type:complete len:227 (+),score=51.09 TRINITY_DN5178_c0_g6_i1:64-744(+)